MKKDFAGKIAFLAQNVSTADFGDAVFEPYALREMNGVRTAVRFREGKVYVPLAFSGMYSPPFVGCVEILLLINDPFTPPATLLLAVTFPFSLKFQ